jgi:hypothetical protein
MVLSGEIKRERIEQSYRRVMKLKSRLNASSALEMYQTQAAKEKLRADQLQLKLDQANAAPDEGKKKKRKKKRS